MRYAVRKSVQSSFKEALQAGQPVGGIGDAEVTAGQGLAVLVEIENPVGMVRWPDDDVDPQIVDPDEVSLVRHPDQIAIPPASDLRKLLGPIAPDLGFCRERRRQETRKISADRKLPQCGI